MAISVDQLLEVRDIPTVVTGAAVIAWLKDNKGNAFTWREIAEYAHLPHTTVKKDVELIIANQTPGIVAGYAYSHSYDPHVAWVGWTRRWSGNGCDTSAVQDGIGEQGDVAGDQGVVEEEVEYPNPMRIKRRGKAVGEVRDAVQAAA